VVDCVAHRSDQPSAAANNAGHAGATKSDFLETTVTTDIPIAFRKTLLTHLPYADNADFAATDELTALGLNSMGVVQLLTDLEETFGLELPDELITEETFGTVGSLWEVVARLVGADRFADV
jgi:acyl carrier protein